MYTTVRQGLTLFTVCLMGIRGFTTTHTKMLLPLVGGAGMQTWPKQSTLPAPQMASCFESLTFYISVSHRLLKQGRVVK